MYLLIKIKTMRFFWTFFFSIILLNSHSQIQQPVCNTPEIESEITENYGKINKIQVDNIENLLINDCLLSDIENNTEVIKHCISTNEFIKDQISKNILIDYENLILQTYHKRKIINSYLAYADYWLYSKAMYCLSLNDTTRYLTHIENSLKINPFFLPSLFEKSKFLLNRNNIKESIDIIKSIKEFYKNNNEIPLLSSIIDLFDTKLTEKGLFFYKTGYFNESLMYFSYLDTVCQNYKTKNCINAQNYIVLSKKGMLQSYFNVADQAVKAGKYTIAESFILKAEEYAALNMDATQEEPIIKEKYRFITQKYLQLYNYYKRNNETYNSRYYLENANRLCRKIYGTDCKTHEINEIEEPLVINTQETSENTNETTKTNTNVSLNNVVSTLVKTSSSYNSEINTKNKQNIILRANEAYDNAEYEKALQLYESAKKQPEIIKGINAKQLENYIQQSAIQVILNKIQTAEYFIWTNNLLQADSVLVLCNEYKLKYSLENNAMLDASIMNFKSKIEEKRCKNIEDEIEVNINIIESKIKTGEFEDILTISNKIDTLKQKTNCKLFIYKRFSSNTEAVISFLKYRNKAKEKFNEADYSAFVQNYLLSDNIYDVSKLENLGIPKVDILSFIEYNYNTETAFTLVKNSIKKQLFDLSFSTLDLIKSKKTNNVLTKDLQIELAEGLTEYQKQKILSDNINLIIKKLSKDKWYSFFNKKYRK